MKIETVILLIISIGIAFALLKLSTTFLNRKEDSLSEDMEKRKKVFMPNYFVKYSGEVEKQDTIEYQRIIDNNVINVLRREDGR